MTNSYYAPLGPVRTYLIKSKDPRYEIEVITHATYWSFVVRKPWPCEDGIYEAPHMASTSMSNIPISVLLKDQADVSDIFTDKVLHALAADADPHELLAQRFVQ